MMVAVKTPAIWCRYSLPLLCLLLAGCGPQVPECPYQGALDSAASAGCLALIDGQLLLVETYSGQMGPPGGKVHTGESAQCGAHRETWEETGLDLMPRQLLAVFDTGFHLYHCEYHRNYDALNAWPSEVRRALWLPVTKVDEVEWRFAGQGKQLQTLIREHFID